MRTRQITPAIATLLFCIAHTTLAAPGKDPETDNHGQHTGLDDAGVRIHIRTEEEKKRRDAENSNRQTELGANRGLERAGERRAEPADVHSQAGGVPQESEEGWYEYFFGKRQDANEQSDLNWYEYLFGKRKTPDHDASNRDEEQDEDSSWWWPFD